MKRLRHLVTALAIGATILASAQIDTVRLGARQSGTLLMDGGGTTNAWGFVEYVGTPAGVMANIPAPTIRVNYMDSVVVHLWNKSNQDHTIHLHGLDVDQANDGVPTTSFSVANNDSATYFFHADHAGSYIYHCHVVTTLHLSMGMYGLIVVEHDTIAGTFYPGSPTYNESYEFLGSELDKTWNDAPLPVPTDLHLFDADYFMLNGKSGQLLFDDTTNVVEVLPNDTVLLRLANIGYSTTKYVFPAGLNPVAYMSDGRVLPAPMPADTLSLYPGERFEVLLTPTTLVEDYIEVYWEHLFRCNEIGMNYIGVNSYVYPTDIPEIPLGEQLAIFPNPAQDELTIMNNEQDVVLARIIDMFGKFVWEGQLVPGNNVVDLSGMASGNYIVWTENAYSKLVITR